MSGTGNERSFSIVLSQNLTCIAVMHSLNIITLRNNIEKYKCKFSNTSPLYLSTKLFLAVSIGSAQICKYLRRL